MPTNIWIKDTTDKYRERIKRETYNSPKGVADEEANGYPRCD